jgi:hypothetical protein
VVARIFISASKMATSPELSQDMLTAIAAMKAVTLLAVMSSGTIMTISFFGFWEHRKEFNLRQPTKRWRLPLILTATVSFCVLCLDCSTAWRTWTSPEEDLACVVVSTIIPFGYIIEKQCLNLFLFDRAKIVHSIVSLGPTKDWYLKMLRWVLFLTLTIGVPLSFYWAPFVAFTGKIAPEGECVFYTKLPPVPVAFFVADSFLSVGMLLIFLAPLHVHSAGLKEVSETHKKRNASFHRMVRTNIILSCCATVSGLIGLVGLSTFNWLNDGTKATAHYPTWGLFIITWDNFLSVIAYVL